MLFLSAAACRREQVVSAAACSQPGLPCIAQRASSVYCIESDEFCRIDQHCIYFVTGNARKESEVNAILACEDIAPFRVQHVDIDLPELQGDPLEIARAKVNTAASRVGGSVLVEDTSLCINALNGLPGPYVRWFFDAIGNEGIYTMLKGYEDKSAYCQCVLGFSSGPGTEPHLFVGRAAGSIREPRGDSGFGWDAVFQPDGFTEPFAEMSMAQKNKISHRAQALALFVDFCRTNVDEIIDAAQNPPQPMALGVDQDGTPV